MTKQAFLALIALMMQATTAQAQDAPAPVESTASGQAMETLLSRFSDDPDRFTQTDGEALYRTTCQACHMEDGKGDAGAGAHPPLAGNPKMVSKHFLAGVILTGYHAMPRFGHQMSDEQVAAVTNYVRSHFGNDHPDPISPDDVGALRPPEDGD
jgi:mono/diheme cytochrome c family protein